MKYTIKEHFGYWLCSWVWLLGMFIQVLTLGWFDGSSWGHNLMDWLDEHGFNMWQPYTPTIDEGKRGP